jgi:hypothetical protein
MTSTSSTRRVGWGGITIVLRFRAIRRRRPLGDDMRFIQTRLNVSRNYN